MEEGGWEEKEVKGRGKEGKGRGRRSGGQDGKRAGGGERGMEGARENEKGWLGGREGREEERRGERSTDPLTAACDLGAFLSLSLYLSYFSSSFRMAGLYSFHFCLLSFFFSLLILFCLFRSLFFIVVIAFQFISPSGFLSFYLYVFGCCSYYFVLFCISFLLAINISVCYQIFVHFLFLFPFVFS